MYIKLDATGRVCAAALGGILPDGMEIAVPDGFEMERHGDWRMENGMLVHDPRPEPEEGETETERLRAENVLLRAQVQALSDRGEFVEDCIAEMATKVYGGV